VYPTPRHVEVLADSGTGGSLVSDAHVAALAREHDATVVSYDTDFARFRGCGGRRRKALSENRVSAARRRG